MKRFIGVTLLALLLISLCLQAARWQFHRHEARHAKNLLIESNINKNIRESELLFNINDLATIAWKKISLQGRFEPEHEILVRNRYHNDIYGYGVVTLFRSDSGKSYWVDRGWVKAGKDATTPPITQKVNSDSIGISARVRVEKIENQLGGTIFAIPAKNGTNILERWNGSASVKTEPVYLDLLSSDRSEFTPEVPTSLPEISDGPHLAYTFQWIVFAILIGFGWFLVIREDRRVQSEKA